MRGVSVGKMGLATLVWVFDLFNVGEFWGREDLGFEV